MITRHRVMQWTATGMLFGGALAISINPKAAIGWSVFVAFLIGHLIYVADSLVIKHNPMLALNVSFMCLDAYAIAIRVW